MIQWLCVLMWESESMCGCLFLTVHSFYLFIQISNASTDSWASKAFSQQLTSRNLCFVLHSFTFSNRHQLQQATQDGQRRYWFVRQNYANDRQAVKSDKLDGAFSDVFCLCLSLNFVARCASGLVCAPVTLCVYRGKKKKKGRRAARMLALCVFRGGCKAGKGERELNWVQLGKWNFWRAHHAKWIYTGSFRDSQDFISTHSLACIPLQTEVRKQNKYLSQSATFSSSLSSSNLLQKTSRVNDCRDGYQPPEIQ